MSNTLSNLTVGGEWGNTCEFAEPLELDTGKSLGEEVGNHVAGRTVLQRDFLAEDLLTDEVVLDVEVLRPGVVDGISTQGNGSLIVLENRCRCRLGVTELGEKLAEPQSLFSGLSGGEVFGFGRRKRDGRLLLAQPGDRSTTEHKNVAGGRLAIDSVSSPIGIAVTEETKTISLSGKSNPEINSTFKVANYTLDCGPMIVVERGHMSRHDTKGEGDVWAGPWRCR